MSILSSRVRNVGGAIIGNTLEWFDILVYAYFVKEIAENFFPSTDQSVSLLLAYGTFGLSFVARPLGGVVLGKIADNAGRRTALVHASGLMCVGTLVIALLPSYAIIGIAAPVLLLIARMMQSFSAGGEFGSATAYLAEQSPHRKAFYSSWQFASQGLGMVLAALCGLALGSHLSSANMVEWGWRIPFLLGAAMGPIAYYLRKNVDETPEFLAESEPTASPSAEFYKRCAVGSGIVLLCTVSIYLLIYVPSFAQTILNKNSDIAYSAALISGITLFIGAPLAGCIADKFGAIRLALLAAISLAFLVVPIFSLLISANDGESILLGQFVLSFIISMYLGAMPTVLSDIFSIRVRSLGMSISYNIAVMSGGGFAQVIFSFLIKSTGNINSPSYYIVFAALVSFLSIVACRKTIAPKRFHGLPQG